MTEAPPLAEIRARYPGVVPENSTLSPAPRQGFSGGRVWRIDTAAGPLALKRHATPCDPDRLDAVGSVLLQAGRMGLEVNGAAVALPVPILDCNGAAVTRIDREFCTLAPWLPGEPPQEAITETMVVRAAEALAKWHLMGRAINMPWRLGPEDELVAFRERRSVIAPAARRRRRRFEEWLFQEPPGEPLDGELRDLAFATHRALRRNASAVKDRLQRCERPTTLELCLRDPHAGNFLFDGERLTGMLDFDQMGFDAPAADLGRLLGSLASDNYLLWRAAIDRYAAITGTMSDHYGAANAYEEVGAYVAVQYWWKQATQRILSRAEQERWEMFLTRVQLMERPEGEA